VKARSAALALAMLLASMACSPRALDVEGHWQLVSFGTADRQTPASSTRGALIEFGDGMVAGHTGCSTFGGKYDVDRDKIQFENVSWSLISCPELREQEDAVTGLLRGTVQAKRGGDTLELHASESDMVMTWERAGPE
jgi:heat shock protein HslJ